MSESIRCGAVPKKFEARSKSKWRRGTTLRMETTRHKPGLDVMITIFDNIRRKIGVFLKNQCYDQNFAYFSFVFSQKRQFFRRIFRRKFFKKSLHRSQEPILRSRVTTPALKKFTTQRVARFALKTKICFSSV
jgi:hypothetical protein